MQTFMSHSRIFIHVWTAFILNYRINVLHALIFNLDHLCPTHNIIVGNLVLLSLCGHLPSCVRGRSQC